MIKIGYAAAFVRRYDKLPLVLQQEVKEKIALLKDHQSHPLLHVHKLHGTHAGRLSLSANYRFRIIFRYINKSTVVLLTVGDHTIYE